VNLRAAAKQVARINQEIKLGLFSYPRHFPDSESAGKRSKTFAEYAEIWLSTLTTSVGTIAHYRGALRAVWVPAIGHQALDEVTQTAIKTIVADRYKAVSAKTINNELIPLRAVFEAAIGDKLIVDSPCRRVKNLKHQKPAPDPFTVDEMEAILGYMSVHTPIQVWAYYEFAFTTGLRPSEQIVVRWSKVDFAASQLRVDTARTYATDKDTKTSTVRDVDLSPRAMAALMRMKPYTFLKGPDAPIFSNPSTGLPWNNAEYQRTLYFQPALKSLGIRGRAAYQTRHTFATTLLMGGVTPSYIARQMGHATTAMLFTVYSKWLDGADKGREAAKVASLHGQPIAPGLSQTA